ncbi:MAG: S-layer homology domain-containing protein [Clostridiales bacterium]|nr:S-layer homology domain-containing protein [Clostridiales bacterium]
MKRNPSLRRLLALTALLALTLAGSLPASALLFGTQKAEAAGEATVAAFAKNGLPGETITFSQEDFRVESGGDVTLDSVVLSALPDPAAGILTLGDQPLNVGDSVARSALSGLRFRAAQSPAAPSSSFSFAPVFSNGVSGREVTVGLYLLSEANSAPVAENLELSTYKNTALTARFAATDPEGDLLTYQLVSKPARGAVTMPGDGQDTFVYTPYENKTGKDSFTYVAVDAVGNTSAPATVKIRIEKPSTKVTYADLDGVPAANAAIRLAEKNIFVGECMGGQYFFQPHLPVTRAQFVAMLMDTAGMETLEDVTTTGFADDTSIPGWARPYVASALKNGLVQGTLASDGQVVFQPANIITRAEASVLLNRVLRVTDVAQPTFGVDLSGVPDWAVQPAANLESCGVLQADGNGSLGLSSTLTRAEAAELLSGALDVLESRESGSWFPW